MNKIFIVLCLFLVLCSSQVLSQNQDAVPVKKVISLELKEKPLKLVAEEILKQTGCRIVFDEKWNNLLLSGQYTNVSLEEFFRRSFRKKNFSLLYEDKENIATLRFFDDKNIGGGAKTLVNSNASMSSEASDSVDPYTGMNEVEIKELHKNQLAAMAQSRNDPDTIDTYTGMTNGEMKKLHDMQSKNMEQEREKSKHK